MKIEIRKILARKIPSVDVVRVDAEPTVDSDGEDSLRIGIVVRRRPPREEAKHLVEVVDEFRTWLVGHEDERFPYFRLLAEDDQQAVS